MFAEVAVNVPLRAGDRAFTFAIPAPLESRLQIGTPVRVPFGRRTVGGFVVGLSAQTARDVKPVASIDDRIPPLPSDLVALASWMADHYVCSVGEAIQAMLPPLSGAAGRTARDPVQEVPRSEHASAAGLEEDPTGIVALLTDRPQGRVALIGGDARFDAYAAALRWAIERGGVIFLSPEVSQAERLATWVQGRVGGPVALVHGNVSGRERWEVWRRIHSGEVNTVVGTRLAVFAPLRRLVLIIVHQEEDASYKEERVPRYHARRVAEERASLAGAALVWGTAAPSTEVARAIEEEHAARLTLPPPVRPAIAVADVRAEAGPLGGLFGRRLYQALARTLPRGRAIIFVPRRGYADFLLCHECGAVPRCPRCDVAMTYHMRGTELRCHLCGRAEPAPETCAVCRGTHLRPHGVGTERVERAARRFFRGTPVMRLDTDVASQEQEQQRIWQQFARRGGLLVGTQLLIKGVGQIPAEVVGAIGVDAGLHLPDFRAAERMYQVLTNLAGLAQREMIIQTFSPSHLALLAVAGQDAGKFYQHELAARRRFGYPPFRTLVNLIVTGAEGSAVRNVAQRLATSLVDHAEVLGPSLAPLSRVRGRLRWQVLIKERDEASARERLAELLKTRPIPRGVRLTIDVDPLDLL